MQINGRYGAINFNEEVVIKPIYDLYFSFRKGFARVKKNGKYGLINLKGEEVIEPKFQDIRGFGDGLWCVGIEI